MASQAAIFTPGEGPTSGLEGSPTTGARPRGGEIDKNLLPIGAVRRRQMAGNRSAGECRIAADEDGASGKLTPVDRDSLSLPPSAH